MCFSRPNLIMLIYLNALHRASARIFFDCGFMGCSEFMLFLPARKSDISTAYLVWVYYHHHYYCCCYYWFQTLVGTTLYVSGPDCWQIKLSLNKTPNPVYTFSLCERQQAPFCQPAKCSVVWKILKVYTRI